MKILDLVKDLREETGAGIMACKKALEESKGNLEKAKKILRERDLAKAAEKKDRETKAGFVATYTHTSGKVGVIAEILCESDFVAKNEDFKDFTKEICLQITAMAPKNLKELLKQEYVRDPSKKVNDLVKATIAKFGENIKVGKFERFEI